MSNRAPSISHPHISVIPAVAVPAAQESGTAAGKRRTQMGQTLDMRGRQVGGLLVVLLDELAEHVGRGRGGRGDHGGPWWSPHVERVHAVVEQFLQALRVQQSLVEAGLVRQVEDVLD